MIGTPLSAIFPAGMLLAMFPDAFRRRLLPLGFLEGPDGKGMRWTSSLCANAFGAYDTRFSNQAVSSIRGI